MSPTVPTVECELVGVVEHCWVAVRSEHTKKDGLAGIEVHVGALVCLADDADHQLGRAVESMELF
jgi:hypothetical protein